MLVVMVVVVGWAVVGGGGDGGVGVVGVRVGGLGAAEEHQHDIQA